MKNTTNNTNGSKSIKDLINGTTRNSVIEFNDDFKIKVRGFAVKENVKPAGIVDMAITVNKLTLFMKDVKVCIIRNATASIKFDATNNNIDMHMLWEKSISNYNGIKFIDTDVDFNINAKADVFMESIKNLSNANNVDDVMSAASKL